jgi:SSS family solute:Na+ symporter
MVEHGITYPTKLVGGVAVPNPDAVVPVVVNTLFPTWFVVLFLFAILAAAMSTASSLFHTASASLERDVYEKGLKKQLTPKKSLLLIRVITLLIVLATLIITLNPLDVVAFMTSFFFGLMACTFLAPYTLMLYWKKTSRIGVWAGMLGGFIFTMLWYIFIYFKTAPKIIGSTLISNYQINMLDPLFIGVPLSFLLTFLFSILVKQDQDEQKTMQKAFEQIK